MLARTHPDPEGRLPMDEATLAKELDLATNAFYTDPEDQSAWFYTSWLFNDQHAFAGQFFYFILYWLHYLYHFYLAFTFSLNFIFCFFTS